ncbi:ABC transporter permease [Heyndrickxia acidiproducens]|uniref:ABC transporter permease n=1 Tax=Heyndrickxia acidiproducens TaxID=1121084 RepID=UPI00277D0EF8|nr:ABC transporter permease [Heyndrickxia acidiproducens]
MIENRQQLFAVHLPVTLEEVCIGFIFSVAGGIVLGIAMYLSRTMEKLLYPFLVVSQTIPLVAISPIFMMWFGYTIWSKVAIIILTAFFPIVISIYDGLKTVDTSYQNLFQTMGASRRIMFQKLLIPMALPQFLSGLKLTIVYCVTGATIGEWLGASAGLGYFSRRMSGNLEAAAVFASVFLLAALGVVLFLFVTFAEKKFLKYKTRT